MIRLAMLASIALVGGLLMEPPRADASPATPVVFPPTRHGAKMVLGNSGSDYGGAPDARDTLLTERMHELGVTLTRIGIHWGGIEPVRGEPYDFAEEDELIDFLEERGIEPLVVLACAPRWAYNERPGDFEFFRDRLNAANLYTVVMPADEYAEEYEAATRAIAARYRGRIRFYEFWNEPDGMAGPVLLRGADDRLVGVRFGGDPVAYTRWLKRTRQALREGDPDALLAAGSMCAPTTHFLEAIYGAGGRGAFDAVSVHPYAADGINVDFLDACRQVMVRRGDAHLGLWITEYSWKTTGVTDEFTKAYRVGDEGEKATLLEDALVQIARRPAITVSVLHSLNDWRDVDDDPATAQGFGVVDYEGAPKPTFAAFRDAIARESKRRDAARGVTGPSVLYPGLPGAFVVTGEPASAGPPRFELPDGWVACRRDPTGENPVYQVIPAADAVAGRTYPVVIGRDDAGAGAPALVHVEIQEPVQVRAAADARTMVSWDDAQPPAVTFDNISPFLVRATPRIEAPAGWQAEQLPEVHLRAGEARTAAVSIRAPGGAAPGWHTARVRARVNDRMGTPLELRLGVAPPCPRAASLDRLGEWTISAGEDARGFRARAGWDDDGLRIEVEARDADHLQTGTDGNEYWRMDSLQIGIDPRFDAIQGALYQVDDYEYIFALPADGEPRAWRLAGPDAIGPAPEVAIEIDRDDNARTTRYRATFPWSAVQGLAPEPGAPFGLSILQNDYDGVERRTVEWGGGIAVGKHPWEFIGVRLQP